MDTDEQLRSAIERDNVHDFAEALEHGADMEFAFREALLHGNADMVGLVLDRGADPNAEMSNVYQYQYYSITPLMIAVWKGHEGVAKLLLERGANPNCEHRFGKADNGVGEITALGKAIDTGSVRMVEILLDGGASTYGVYAGEPGGRYSMEILDAYEWAEYEGTQEIRDFLEERKNAIRQRASGAETQTDETQMEATESAPPNESAETAATEAPRTSQQALNDALFRAGQGGEAVSKAALEALPASTSFDINFTSKGFIDELPGIHMGGEIMAGAHTHRFGISVSYGTWDAGDYQAHWREAAERLVRGHDRSAFVFNTGANGWGTAFAGRMLAWRDGERVYMALDHKTADTVNVAAPYQDIESLQAKCARRYHVSKPEFWAVTLQAFRDYLSSRGVDRARLQELERPCERCGEEVRRCNRCGGCMNCGGVSDEELGYCRGCENMTEPTAPVNGQADDEQPSTEADWLGCGEGGPGDAISLLRYDPSRQRKLFLAGCGWARRFWERLARRSRTAVEVYERLADGEAPEGDYEAAISHFEEMFAKHGDYFAFEDVKESEMDFFTALIQARAAWQAALPYMKDDPDAEAAIVLPARGVFSLGRGAYLDASDEFAFASDDRGAEYRAQCDIIRDVFGNAARPVTLEPAWLTRNAAAVEKIARAIYDERAFGRLPELAEALEKSGCLNKRILSHCRSEGEHVRGCWVIDLLLSKERLAFPMGERMPLTLPTVNY